MSAKSKLTLALLGATALFTFNPGLLPRLFNVDERVAAEEMTLDSQTAADLDSLAGSPSVTGGKLNGINAALAPQDKSTGLDATASVAVKENLLPGENPFEATPAKPVVDTQPVAVKSDTSFAIGGKQADVASVSVQPANPFAVQAEQEKAEAAAPAAKARIDDRALRYYAASKDLKRLGAEMRRLKALYPDWQPPKDLFSPVANVSEQPLWDIYKTGDYARVRNQIALMQSANPKWIPSDDLMLKLQMGEARALINRSATQARWQEVISTAQATPSILVCDEMQVLWNVGEAFAHRKNYAQSFELYKYILSNCSGADLRTATVQKASLLLPPQGMTALIQLGRTNADGSSEFENIGFDGVRRQLGDYIQNGDFASTPTDDELKRFVDFVERTGSGQDAALIGWYFYAQEDWKTANAWFVSAAKYERSPKNIEGVILTLRNMERAEDALKLARRYMKASPEIADQYVEIISSLLTAEEPQVVLKDKDIADFEKVVADVKSPLGAQALGWKYLAGENEEKAQDWFTKSVSWKPTEGGVVGLAVMASRTKNHTALTAIKNKYLKDYAALEDFKVYRAKVYKAKKKKIVTSNAEKPAKKQRRYLFQSDDG